MEEMERISELGLTWKNFSFILCILELAWPSPRGTWFTFAFHSSFLGFGSEVVAIVWWADSPFLHWQRALEIGEENQTEGATNESSSHLRLLLLAFSLWKLIWLSWEIISKIEELFKDSLFIDVEGSLECAFPLFCSSTVVGVLDKILIIKFFNHFQLHRDIKSYDREALVQLYFTAHVSSQRWHICFSFCCHYSSWDCRASVISVVEKRRQRVKSICLWAQDDVFVCNAKGQSLNTEIKICSLACISGMRVLSKENQSLD